MIPATNSDATMIVHLDRIGRCTNAASMVARRGFGIIDGGPVGTSGGSGSRDHLERQPHLGAAQERLEGPHPQLGVPGHADRQIDASPGRSGTPASHRDRWR